MYLRFDHIDELVTAIVNDPLAENESWLILLADQHQNQIEHLIHGIGDIPFNGAVFPGLISGKRMLSEGALIRKVRFLAPPVFLSMPVSAEKINTLPTHEDIPSAGATCLCLVDCLSKEIDELLGQIYSRFGPRCSYFGSGTGNHDLTPKPSLFGNWGQSNNGALIAIIDQPSQSTAKHGWKRHRGPIVASRTTGNIVHELDWEDAETAYRSILPKNLSNTPPERFYKEVTPKYPFAVEYPGAEDVVRDPIALTGNGDVMFLSDIRPGSLMYLVESSPDDLINAARNAVNTTVTAKTESVLVCDCLSRTIALDTLFPSELKGIYDQLIAINPNLELEGVIALGEIASDGKRPVNLYNKTFGICGFYD